MIKYKLGYDGVHHVYYNPYDPDLNNPDILERFYDLSQAFPHDDCVLVVLNHDKIISYYTFDTVIDYEDFREYCKYMPWCGHFEYYDLRNFRKYFTFNEDKTKACNSCPVNNT